MAVCSAVAQDVGFHSQSPAVRERPIAIQKLCTFSAWQAVNELFQSSRTARFPDGR